MKNKLKYLFIVFFAPAICLGQKLTNHEKYQRLLQSSQNFDELISWQENTIKQKEIDIQVSKNMIQLINQEKAARIYRFYSEFMTENRDNENISVTMNNIKQENGSINYICIAEIALASKRKVVSKLSSFAPDPEFTTDGHINVNIRVDKKGQLAAIKLDSTSSTLNVSNHYWNDIEKYLLKLNFEENSNSDFEAGVITLTYLFYN